MSRALGSCRHAIARRGNRSRRSVCSPNVAPPREVRPLQRDLAQLLEELAMDFPLLGSLVEQRAGGQKRLPLTARGYDGDARGFIAASISTTSESQDSAPVDISSAESASQTVNPAVNEAAEEFAVPNATIQMTGKPIRAGRPITGSIFNSRNDRKI